MSEETEKNNKMTKKKGTLLVWLTSEELMIYLNFNLHMLVNLWSVTLRTTDFFYGSMFKCSFSIPLHSKLLG